MANHLANLTRKNQLIARRIKEWRIMSCVTQEHLALQLGLSQSSIAGYETGRVVPTDVRLKEISDALGVDDLMADPLKAIP